MEERFKQQLQFLVEIDKMKSIYRQTILIDRSRRETDAEHSWHFAMAALILAEYAAANVNLHKVVQMALVHDLVEISAGDTYAYDDVGNAAREERERIAADEVFALLPAEQADLYKALWEEFERAESAEALYANAMDSLQPMINNYMTQGEMWQKNGATSGRVFRRLEKVKAGAPKLYAWAVQMIEESVAKGYLKR